VAKACEKAIRTDVTTKVDTIIENAKDKHGVCVPRTMAYRAKNEAVRVVLGDHVEQYRRIRDYLNTVIQTNPGSRCVVTTRMQPENPSNNPRFHWLFIEGFLNGCRPFIGKLQVYFLVVCFFVCYKFVSLLFVSLNASIEVCISGSALLICLRFGWLFCQVEYRTANPCCNWEIWQ
jgi:hypothetical protein